MKYRQVLKQLRSTGLTLLAATSYSNISHAYQPDAPFEVDQKKHAKLWKQQDSSINKKLKALEKKHGKRPNIIYILADDIGWGELGSYGGGKVRGTPTPNLDTLADQGMKFLSHYSEPMCTPTRVSLLTGRIPARTGLEQVLNPGDTQGLVAEEYTLAELLSDAGYHTAMFGKWHVGEANEHQPTNQGFDYAFYTLYNGAAWPWAENAKYFNSENVTVGEVPYFMGIPENYSEEFNITVHGILESHKGEKPKEVAPLSLERYNVHDDELTDKIISYMEDKADSNKPFFVYYASNANQVFACPPEHRNAKYVDSGNCQASQLAQHDKNIKRLMDKVDDLKIAKNTLVVWMSDNGPMYIFKPSTGYTWLRGKKGDVYEGGVRTPAMAVWPGIIEPGQDPMGLVHVSDWYTTAARIAGAVDKIPNDRVTDGIDQTSLLVNGEEGARRNYIFHYNLAMGDVKGMRSHLAAFRFGDLKMHTTTGEFYNIIRDPAEMMPNIAPYLWAINPMKNVIMQHKKMMMKFPNRKLPMGGQAPQLDLQ